MRSLIVAVVMFVAGLLMIGHAAFAQQAVVVNGVWCDKVEQSEALFQKVIREDKELQVGLAEVNTNDAVPSCAMGIIAMMQGEMIRRLEFNGKVYGIFEVVVLGFQNGQQMIRLPQPMVQYGLRPLVGEVSA